MPHSLKKGQRAEREVIDTLQPILDHVWGTVNWTAPKLERRGLGLRGEDISGLEWLSLEVKHREQLQVDQWWEQAVEQSKRRNGLAVTPVLIYKRNRVAWRVRMPGFAADKVMHACIVDISWEDFQMWFYHRAMKALDYECDQRAR